MFHAYASSWLLLSSRDFHEKKQRTRLSETKHTLSKQSTLTFTIFVIAWSKRARVQVRKRRKAHGKERDKKEADEEKAWGKNEENTAGFPRASRDPETVPVNGTGLSKSKQYFSQVDASRRDRLARVISPRASRRVWEDDNAPVASRPIRLTRGYTLRGNSAARAVHRIA